MRLQKKNKLSRRYFGPFQVLKRIGENAYKYDLRASSRIHLLSHFSYSEVYRYTWPIGYSSWIVGSIFSLVLMAESILQQRVLHKGNGQLVQWLSSGLACLIQMPLGKPSWLSINNFPSWTLRTMFLFKGLAMLWIWLIAHSHLGATKGEKLNLNIWRNTPVQEPTKVQMCQTCQKPQITT